MLFLTPARSAAGAELQDRRCSALGGLAGRCSPSFLAMVSVTWVAEALLFLGLAMTLLATVGYVREGLRVMSRPSTSA